MDNRNKIAIIVVPILTVILIIICYFYVMKYIEEQKPIIINDTLLLKKNYESENHLYYHVDIDVDTEVFYISALELQDFQEGEEVMDFIGDKECNITRNVIEPLLKASSVNKKEIYYIEINTLEEQEKLSEFFNEYEIPSIILINDKEIIFTKTFKDIDTEDKIKLFEYFNMFMKGNYE
jgi:hypothetical protein